MAGLVFDLDGTLVLRDDDQTGKHYSVLPGAADVLQSLRALRVPFITMTNDSARTSRTYAEQLRACGLDLRDDEMMTPVDVAIDFFPPRGMRKILVLGAEGVHAPLREAGLEVILPSDEHARADAVFVGWLQSLALRDIEVACKAIWDGARLYATSTARVFATKQGKSPSASGVVSAMISHATQCRAVALGKPSLHALRSAARRLNAPAKELVIVGDDPRLEIAMARRGGAYGVAVMSGLADAAELKQLAPKLRPDLVLESVQDLMSSPLFG